MIKYDLLPEQLLHEGTITNSHLFEPGEAKEKDILTVHEKIWWKKLTEGGLTRAEERKTGFVYSPELIHREITIMQGTVDAALFALHYGIAMNTAGGTHHAYTYKGEGFCLLNDIAIAARYLLDHKLAKQILVVDLDVHQGDGTAEIFTNEPRVFTFSMHGANNFPMQKQRSDKDIHLEDNTGDKDFLKLLKNTLPELIDKVQPDFIFYQSGVDVLEQDKLGRISLTIEGCRQRDKYVLESAKKNNIPIVASMGGGYSERIADIIDAHANTYRLAQEIYF